MPDLGSADSKCERTKCAVGRRVAIAADNGFTRPCGTQFRAHHMDNTSVRTVPTVGGNAVGFGVGQ